MTQSNQQIRQQIIQKLIELAHNKVSSEQADVFSAFISQFYTLAPLEDLLERELIDLYGGAWSLWQMVETRADKEVKLRVYNPDIERHGWQSKYTIVELAMDDMPFIIDSVGMALNRLGYTNHLIINVGGIQVKRNASGKAQSVHASDASVKGALREAHIHIEIDTQTDAKELDKLTEHLRVVIADIRMCVEDWAPMRKQITAALDELKKIKHTNPEDVTEAMEALAWMDNNHFTYLGYREYDLITVSEKNVKESAELTQAHIGKKALHLRKNTSLGVLRDDSTSQEYRLFSDMPEEAERIALSDQIIMIAKTNTLATVHRPVYTDCVDVKQFNSKGEVIGVRRFIGLYTSTAYNTSPRYVPLLRKKVANIMEASNIPANSHAGKSLIHILHTLPRDDLFQATEAELLDLATGILHLQERQRLRLFVRRDLFGRFYSCLVYVPRDRYNTKFRNAVSDILKSALHGTEVQFTTQFTDSILARVHFMVRVEPAKITEFDLNAIEARIVELGRTWEDDLHTALVENYGEEKGNKLCHKYRKAFPVSYQEIFLPRKAVYDIEHVEYVLQTGKLAISFYHPLEKFGGTFRFKLFFPEKTIPLSDVLPILENMGLRVLGERPHTIQFEDESQVWINDFGIETQSEVNIDEIRHIFQDAFRHVWYGKAEDDGFNCLVLASKLHWREVAMLRAYAKYMRQIGVNFSQPYIEETLAANPQIAHQLIGLFDLRFNPQYPSDNQTQCDQLEAEILKNLEAVANLDQDRILRHFLEVIKATLRTNFYQVDAQGEPKPCISFKFDPAKIKEIPRPRPHYEIFVYSPRVEGVHLRGAKIARGGLRWSDRREDFRTEVLGLMKAQKVKNALIVPSGAKGGFVCKALPAQGSRDEVMAEVVYCYQTFIRGLLDITDNLKGNEVIPPEHTRRYDNDDPYLVVAADKGTATFSDVANAIAAEYDFWLNDAFASGGSAGYDHKKMGITARGAWESVKRHFRELGHNTQTQPFTVVGIGDMAGDVFGNGMLLSDQIKLVGAFNHMHIFLDPDPDPRASYTERKRLFDLPRSGWNDYNEKLISKGGGVFDRKAKSIPLGPELQKLLGTKESKLEPNQVIKLMLRAQVDLLWNGGIGTFVKATREQDLDVGDRTNDAIRINATQLRCRVVGEGGNLGMTQLARIEYALQGGKVYSDFIDNSAGVDCSDHEVNIKILLNEIVQEGDMTLKQRNALLADMTNEVSDLVLLNNYRQTQAVSIASARSVNDMELYRRYIEDLERTKHLDRALEYLPDNQEMIERRAQNKGLTVPELSVVFAYCKNRAKEYIMASDLPEDKDVYHFLGKEFPRVINQKYGKYLKKHSLKREIIATQLCNMMINEVGITFLFRLRQETGATLVEVAKAYVAAKSIFNLTELWEMIESFDYKIPADVQYYMMFRIIRLIRRVTRWLVRNRRQSLDISKVVKQFAGGMQELIQIYPDLLTGSLAKSFQRGVKEFTDAGVPDDIAQHVAGTSVMFSAMDIIEVAQQYNLCVKDVAAVFFEIGEALDFDWFREQINAHPVENHWEGLARSAYRDDLDWQQRELSLSVIFMSGEYKTPKERVDAWMCKYEDLASRWKDMLSNLKASGSLDMVMFSVALRELLDLTQTSLSSRDTVCCAPEPSETVAK